MAEEAVTIRELIRRSRKAVLDHDREGWLALWAPDAVIQDPVGPSPFDPDGNGHHGPEGIAAFYDKVIGPNERITFEISDSYDCGNDVADVGLIRTVHPGGTHSDWNSAKTKFAEAWHRHENRWPHPEQKAKRAELSSSVERDLTGGCDKI